MIGRYIKSFILFWGMIVLLTGCADAVRKDGIADKTYLYEKEGFGGNFTIQMKSDGTFSYYEGELSSYIGTGEWKLFLQRPAERGALYLCRCALVCIKAQQAPGL